MPLTWGTTDQVALNGVKIISYGPSGAGKTEAIGTLPAPVIGSAESGLLSLRRKRIPYAVIKTMADLVEFYQWNLRSAEARQFASVGVDSISEIAEVVLKHELQFVKDPRQAYGELIVKMLGIVRDFRDLPGKHVYITAKAEFTKDELGRLLWLPMMPGSKLGNQLPYYFDEVFYAHTQEWEGKKYHLLQTQLSAQVTAKDRSGSLQPMEVPDLGAIINKILSA